MTVLMRGCEGVGEGDNRQCIVTSLTPFSLRTREGDTPTAHVLVNIPTWSFQQAQLQNTSSHTIKPFGRVGNVSRSAIVVEFVMVLAR